MAVKKKTATKAKTKPKVPAKKAAAAKSRRPDGPTKTTWKRQWKQMDGGVPTEHLSDDQQVGVIEVLRDLMAASMRHVPGCTAAEDIDCDCAYDGGDMILQLVGTLGNMRMVHHQAAIFTKEVEQATGKKVTVRRKTKRKTAKKKTQKT